MTDREWKSWPGGRIGGEGTSVGSLRGGGDLRYAIELFIVLRYFRKYVKIVINNGGTGVFVRSPDGTTRSEALPTGKNCTNYKAEIEALVHAVRILGDTIDAKDQIVFLTDARSVLEATTNSWKTATSTKSPKQPSMSKDGTTMDPFSL